jgi:DNA (cytosine-5)-methyltransferase 1
MQPRAYYNEIDPYAAQWLKNLIAENLIAPGDVDTRSVKDVQPDDLTAYTQHHFFAGIGGWSYALRLAGWPDDRPVWTGSCPCQPFSAAGQRKGFADDRHLWPDWFSLIRERKPAKVFGEQVSGAIKQGWLDAVFAGLEAEGYACGAAVLPACSVGAPHIRQRLWFVADAGRIGGQPDRHDVDGASGESRGEAREQRFRADARAERTVGSVVDAVHAGRPERWTSAGNGQVAGSGVVSELADANGRYARAERLQRGGEYGLGPQDGGASFWSDADWLLCTDGKARPVESGTFPLAHGIPGRVGCLRAYGNAIVPQVAAEFIAACA